jgi:hypothetical protein
LANEAIWKAKGIVRRSHQGLNSGPTKNMIKFWGRIWAFSANKSKNLLQTNQIESDRSLLTPRGKIYTDAFGRRCDLEGQRYS